MTKTRRPRAELERLVLEAGIEVLTAASDPARLEKLTYQRVFAHLEETKGVRVSRASVHERIWDNLQDFQLSVVEKMLASFEEPTITPMTEAITALVQDTPDDLTERRLAFQELTRVAMNMSRDITATNPTQRLYSALRARVVYLPPGDQERQRLEPLLKNAREQMLQPFAELFSETMIAFEIRAKAPYAHIDNLPHLLADMFDSLVDADTAFFSEDRKVERRNEAGEASHWSRPALLTWALIVESLEFAGDMADHERTLGV